MKIVTRLICLMTAAVSLGLMGALALEQIERERVQAVNQRIQQNFSNQARQLFQLKEQGLSSYTSDNAHWDELALFVQTVDRNWIYQGIITSFPYHQVDAVWVYSPKQKLIYGYIQGQGDPLSAQIRTLPPIPPQVMPRVLQELQQKRQISFFHVAPEGTWEFRGASIYSNTPSKTHQGQPQGYLLVGRRWSSAYMDELGNLMGAELSLNPINNGVGGPAHSQPVSPGDTQASPTQFRTHAGELLEQITLYDWQQKPLQQLTIKSEEPLLYQLERLTFLRAIILTSGGVAILVGFPILLLLWIGDPLRRLGKSLTTEDTAHIQNLKAQKNEFGSLARLIEQFFSQKETLVREMGERQRIESALRENHDRYALAVQGANDGLWVWDLRTNQAYFSPRWRTMLGLQSEGKDSLEPYPPDRSHPNRNHDIKAEFGIKPDVPDPQSPKETNQDTPAIWFERIHPNDYEQVRQEIDHHLTGLTPYLEHEHRLRLADGSYHWMLCRGLAVRDENGIPYRIAGSLTDLTHRKVLYDPLTKLPNRTLFLERLQQELAYSQREPNSNFAVLFLDLDRFKSINDSLGHLAGDQLLIEIARRFKEVIRPSDTIARLGGDEFALLLHDVGNVSGAIQVAHRLQQQMQRSIVINGQEIFSGTSIGIALNQPERNLLPEDLLRSADAAMYRAKSLGRGRYQVFDANMHQSSQERLHIESWLRHAIDRQELRLHYQPILYLQTRKLSGFEALIRWQHPQRGLIAPADFITIAEETGLISSIGHWVLESACQQMALWQQQFPALPDLSVSVNLSAKQFVEADFAQQVSKILRSSGLSPRRLKLEVTEATLIQNPEAAAQILRQIKAAGVKIELDDFGTGYCSLSYLHNFAIDALKIDRSFIKDITQSEKHSAIVKTLITLAHTLGIYVVAEGLETEAQREHLRQLNCEYGQGYLFSKPLPVEAATQWLSQQLLSVKA
jgi:diguanylate cyclase (GGDEF)-like protein